MHAVGAADMRVDGTRHRIVDDVANATHVDQGRHLIPWKGSIGGGAAVGAGEQQQYLWVDKFDVRCLLERQEQLCLDRGLPDPDNCDVALNVERYRDACETKNAPADSALADATVAACGRNPAHRWNYGQSEPAVRSEPTFVLPLWLHVPPTIDVSVGRRHPEEAPTVVSVQPPGSQAQFLVMLHTVRKLRELGTDKDNGSGGRSMAGQLEVLLRAKAEANGDQRLSFLCPDSPLYAFFLFLRRLPGEQLWALLLNKTPMKRPSAGAGAGADAGAAKGALGLLGDTYGSGDDEGEEEGIRPPKGPRVETMDDNITTRFVVPTAAAVEVRMLLSAEESIVTNGDPRRGSEEEEVTVERGEEGDGMMSFDCDRARSLFYAVCVPRDQQQRQGRLEQHDPGRAGLSGPTHTEIVIQPSLEELQERWQRRLNDRLRRIRARMALQSIGTIPEAKT